MSSRSQALDSAGDVVLRENMERILSFLRKIEQDSDWGKRVQAMREVHPTWRQSVNRSIQSVFPRVRTSVAFEECVNSLNIFPCLRRVTLPPFYTDPAVDLGRLTILTGLESLEVGDVNLPEAASASVSAISKLTELRVHDAKVNSILLSSLSALAQLCALRLRRVDVEGEVNAGVLRALPSTLRDLEITRSPCIYDISLQSCLGLHRLEKMKIGVGVLREDDLTWLSSLKQVTVSLEVYKGLFPSGIAPLGEIQTLEALSLGGKTIRFSYAGQVHYFPPQITSLSVSVLFETRGALQEFLHFAERLTDLSFYMPSFQRDIDLSKCTNLRTLKLSGDLTKKFFDGNALATVQFLTNLESLQIGGDVELSGSHLANLRPLTKLSELSIVSCVVTHDGYKELANLKIQGLSFYYCSTLCPHDFCEMSHLKRLTIACCLKVEQRFKSLLEKSFFPRLDYFGFKCFSGSTVKQDLAACFEVGMPHTVDLDVAMDSVLWMNH